MIASRPVRAGRTARTHASAVAALLGVLGATGTVRAQDPCPSASAVDAEAGWAAYADSDMQSARDRFEAALDRCANDQYARTGLGYVHLRDGDEAAAERLWSEVLVAEPDNVDALVGMGLARWRAGDVDAVRELFSRVLEIEPGHSTATEYLERVSAESNGRTPARDPADQAWTSGDTDRAVALYRARLDADPDDPTALLRVALARAWAGEYAPAVAMLDRLIERSPGDLDARLARARVRAWAGDLGAARSEVREILAVQPDSPDALEALALFQSWSGEHEQALEGYDVLLAIAPEDTGVRLRQAQALAWSADFDAARGAYDAILERDPDDVDARLGLARTLAFARRFDASIAEYDRLLAREPSHVGALVGEARTLGWAGRLVTAEAVATRAVAADSTSAEAWSALGGVYRLQGRDADAVQALDTATRLAPTLAEARDQLRSLRLTMAPVARPTVIYASDSDDNRVVTTALAAGWSPTPRLAMRAEAYHRDLDRGLLVRTAQGALVSAAYELRPGWLLSAELGGSRADGVDQGAALEYRAAVRTPRRRSLSLTLAHAARVLNETALMAEVGVRSRETLLAARWVPGRSWLVDGTVGVGSFDGSEPNGRRSASLAASRGVGRHVSVGTSLRGFSFEKDLVDGYFDPDFYGVAELTGSWLFRPSDWSFLVELAPGVQRVRRDGSTSGSLRSRARVAYRLGGGREVSLAFGYSSAGLVSFASSAADYRYTALILGSSWVF